jgi:TrmH family RNA methyltransferase
MGATFFLPLRKGHFEELRELAKKNAWTALGASAQGSSLPKESYEKILLVLGSESHGLSQESRNLCRMISIPMSHRVDSLNVAVAGGILMHALRGFKHG